MADSDDFVAGNLALDLLNTGPTGPDAWRERLGSPDALLAWLSSAGLLDPGEARRLRGSPPEVRRILSEAKGLRDAVDAFAQAVRDGTTPEPHDVFALDRVLAARSCTVRLVAGPEGTPVLAEEATERAPRGILAPVARAAAELLAASDPARLRQCADEACARWFIDTSKNGKRRWCSMATCGNRAKAARHYRRVTESGSSRPAKKASAS